MSCCFLDFSVGVGAFVTGLSQIFSFYSCYGSLFGSFGFSIDIFVKGKIETPLKSNYVVKVPVDESLNNFCARFCFSAPSHDEP